MLTRRAWSKRSLMRFEGIAPAPSPRAAGRSPAPCGPRPGSRPRGRPPPPGRELEPSRGGVEGGEELVRHEGVRPREPVEQGGLPGVRVAHQGDHGEPDLLPPPVVERPGAAHRDELPLDLPDLVPDPAAVLLQLLLSGPPGSDPSAEAREFPPPSDQPPDPEGELGQLHLELPFPGPRPPGEDVEDHLPPVEHLHLETFLQVCLLLRPKKVLEDDQVDVVFPDRFLELLHRPRPDQGGRVFRYHHLGSRAGHDAAGRLHEAGKLRQQVGGVRNAGDGTPLPLGVNQPGPFGAVRPLPHQWSRSTPYPNRARSSRASVREGRIENESGRSNTASNSPSRTRWMYDFLLPRFRSIIRRRSERSAAVIRSARTSR